MSPDKEFILCLCIHNPLWKILGLVICNAV